jgi:excisionase family DNA binding protein
MEVWKMLVWIEELKQRAEDGHLLRVREIARLLGVSRQQIYKMMKAGKIPGVCRLSIRGIRVCAARLLEWSKQRMPEEKPGGNLIEPARDAREECG